MNTDERIERLEKHMVVLAKALKASRADAKAFQTAAADLKEAAELLRSQQDRIAKLEDQMAAVQDQITQILEDMITSTRANNATKETVGTILRAIRGLPEPPRRRTLN